MRLPRDHSQRLALNDEIHARPPEALAAPLRLSFLALYADPAARDSQWDQVAELARRFGVEPPSPDANHFSADLGAFRVKWERHTEFSRYKFIVPGHEDYPFARPAIEEVPPDWLEALPGEVMVATHVAFFPATDEPPDFSVIAARYFHGNILAGSGVSGGSAFAVTDFRIGKDGFSRLLVQDRSLTPRQAGRAIQRLLEIDTYRMMALLALPVARELTLSLNRSERELAGITRTCPHCAEQIKSSLNQSERELAGITASLADAKGEEEAELLDRLTRLEAAIERRYEDNMFRFAASAAYYGLVQRRISELREQRIPGLQTFQEFLERRLTPAMNTCQAAAARQESLSQRVARASQLLATRVEVSREAQSHALLASMNRRAKLQLRLQETVEGLSVAAVTYYVVALVGHIAQGLADEGMAVHPDLIEAASIPIVALLTWLGVRRIRRLVTSAE